MLKDTSSVRLIGAWFAAVAVTFACSVVMGAALTVSTGALLLAVSLVPPAIIRLVWRGAPPLTVAELLYPLNKEKAGR